jgi:hypothetical protein
MIMYFFSYYELNYTIIGYFYRLRFTLFQSYVRMNLLLTEY